MKVALHDVSLGVSVEFWQTFLSKVSAVSVGQDTRIAFSRQEGDHTFSFVLLTSLLWK